MKFLMLTSLLSLNVGMAKDLTNLRCISEENQLVLEWKESYGELQFSELATGYEVYFDDSIIMQKSLELETPAFIGKSLYTLYYAGDSELEPVAEITVDGSEKVSINVIYAYGNGEDGDLKINGEYICQ